MATDRFDYDVFISYSHGSDEDVAVLCQRVLQALRRRYLGRPALRVFRDDTSLGAGPDLWSEIESVLRSSRFFLLVASPHSVKSSWVQREVTSWLALRGTETFFIVLSDGTIKWGTRDFDWEKTTALARDSVEKTFKAEPLWVNLRWTHAEAALDEDDVRLRDAIATLAAPMHGVRKDELESADIRELRRGRRQRGFAVVTLSVLLVLALVGAALAIAQTISARAQATTATMSKVQVEADQIRPQDSALAAQLDLVADRSRPNPSTRTELVAEAGAPLSQPTAVGVDALAATYSPDGKTAAVGGADGSIVLWDLIDPAVPRRWAPRVAQLDGQVNGLAYRPDGRVLAVGSAPGRLSLWSAADPVHVVPLASVQVGDVPVVAVAFAPGGRVVATSDANNATRLWNVADPRRPIPIGSPVAGYRGLSFDPVGPILAVGDLHTNAVHLWNVADPAHPVAAGPDLVGHQGQVNATRFSPDGRTLASGGADTKLIIWDVAEPGAPRVDGTYRENSNAVLAVAYSPDGSMIASASADRTVRLFQVVNPAVPDRIGTALAGHTGFIEALDFSPDSRHLLSTGADQTMRIWTMPATTLLGAATSVLDAHFAPHHPVAAASDYQGHVLLWDTSDPTQPRRIGPGLAVGTSPVTQFTFSPDGRLLVDAVGSSTAALWSVADPARPTLLGTLDDAGVGISSLAVGGPAGHTLAVGGQDGSTRLWDLTDPGHAQPLNLALPGHQGPVHAVAFSPDGWVLVTGGDDAALRQWVWPNRDSRLPSLGPPLASGHTQAIQTLAFSPDGRWLASAGQDQAIRVLDLGRPSELRPPLLGHTDSVLAVAFSPDGRRLASAGVDTTVRLWTFSPDGAAAPDGQPLTGHTNEVDSVEFDPTGAALLSGGLDGTARMWLLSPTEDAQILCARSGQALTPAAWSTYVSPDLGYDPPCVGNGH